MKPIHILILCTLLLSACSTHQGTGNSSQQTLSIVVSEASSSTLFRATSEDEFTLARIGDEVHAGTELITGSQDGAKLDFSDGTVLRVGANSYLTVLESNPDSAARISLLTGNIWIILNGEDVTIETTVGEAVVTGSYMSIGFDGVNQEMQVTCLEGNCALQNDLGTVSLTSGQAASIGGNQAPSQAQPINDQQLSEWVQVNPEVVAVAGRTPDPAYSKPTDEVNADGYTNLETFPAYLENNCLGGTGKLSRTNWNWLWVWVTPNGSPVVMGMVLPPDKSVSFLMPVGEYVAIADWTDEGSISHQLPPDQVQIFEPGFSGVYIDLCPDDPPLPGRPPEFYNMPGNLQDFYTP